MMSRTISSRGLRLLGAGGRAILRFTRAATQMPGIVTVVPPPITTV